jgi:hypothetical protein
MSEGTASPRISGRELLLLAVLGIAAALAMHWPLPLHLGRDIAQDLGDPLVQAWQVAWDGHALAHQPASLFQANTFWPMPDSLAVSDALVGYAPAGLIGTGVHAAVARYDVLFLFAYALCFAGAWLLARELGANRVGAAVAGLAFAYAPWRLEQEGHLHVISSGGIALALFLLLRGYRRAGPPTILAGWLVAAWQFSLGFTLGLMLLYLLAAGTAAAAVIWWRGRPRPPRGVLVATAAGMLCFALVAGLLARPYVRTLADHPEAHRTIADVANFSGPPREFLAAARSSRVWGAATAPLRDGLGAIAEMTLFPGLAILGLALVGWRAGPLPRRRRRGLALGALAFAILSLGVQVDGVSWLYPYRWLYELLPGWQGIRVPGRLNTLTSLCLALLAAGGVQALAAGVNARWGPRAAAGAVTLACLAILAEGWGFADHPTVPIAPRGFSAAPPPTLHLPATDAADNRRYVLWSTDGFSEILNGRGSYIPRQFERTLAVTRTFPDARSVGYLRRLGVRSVTVHLARTAPGSVLRRAATRSLRGLDLERTRDGTLVRFVLR